MKTMKVLGFITAVLEGKMYHFGDLEDAPGFFVGVMDKPRPGDTMEVPEPGDGPFPIRVARRLINPAIITDEGSFEEGSEFMTVLAEARKVWRGARADLGPSLGGWSPVDLFLDNLPSIGIERARHLHAILGGEQVYPRTWLEVAIERGATVAPDGSIGGSEFQRVGIAILNGCPGCGATVGPGNSFQVSPTDPYAWCQDCAGIES